MGKYESAEERRSKNIKIVLILFLAVICVLGYGYYITRNIALGNYASSIAEFWTNNTRNHFTIDQILIYSSAHAYDSSGRDDMSDVTISQYTDIAIYINNQSKVDGLNEDNTISELYIDNINIETGQKNGTFKFGYKSPLDVGKYVNVVSSLNEKLDYKILHSNSEKSDSDNVTPTFFTDCSNPITLGYINSGVVKHYKFSEEGAGFANNGTILKTANVDIDKITPTITFDIHIKTNMNERYLRKMYINVPLENSQGSVTSGYIIVLNNFNGNQYSFIKE